MYHLKSLNLGGQGFLALEGELTPILVQMVKSANMNGLLDNDNESSKYQNMYVSLTIVFRVGISSEH